MSNAESNMCVLVHFLGVGGIPIKYYSPCYILVGKVRDWIMHHKKRIHNVFIHRDNIGYRSHVSLQSPNHVVNMNEEFQSPQYSTESHDIIEMNNTKSNISNTPPSGNTVFKTPPSGNTIFIYSPDKGAHVPFND